MTFSTQTLLKRLFIVLSIAVIFYILMLTSSRNNAVLSQNLGIGDTSPTATPTLIPTDTPTPTPTLDIVVPSVTITNPQNGSTVRRNKTVTIQANASDNVAVDRVEFYVNSVFTCVDTSLPYTCQWLVPSKPNVVYQLRATAFDTSGNSATHTISVTSRP